MNKEIILHLIIDALQRDLSALQKAVKLAHDSATHGESKAENKYDTRGLEASYLAHGQSQRAAEIAISLMSYQRLEGALLVNNDRVAVNSLVKLLDGEGETRWLWLGAEAGGLKVSCGADNVTVVTPHSPLGKALLGKMAGDEVMIKLQEVLHEYEIVDLY